MKRQLGRALGLLLREHEVDAAISDDLDAFHAPGECYPIAFRGAARRHRLARRRACHAAGVRNMRLLRRQMRRAMGNDAWVYRRYGLIPY